MGHIQLFEGHHHSWPENSEPGATREDPRQGAEGAGNPTTPMSQGALGHTHPNACPRLEAAEGPPGGAAALPEIRDLISRSCSHQERKGSGLSPCRSPWGPGGSSLLGPRRHPACCGGLCPMPQAVLAGDSGILSPHQRHDGGTLSSALSTAPWRSAGGRWLPRPYPETRVF